MSTNDKSIYYRTSIAIPLTRKDKVFAGIEALGLSGFADAINFFGSLEPTDIELIKPIIGRHHAAKMSDKQARLGRIEALKDLSPDELAHLIKIAKEKTALTSSTQ